MNTLLALPLTWIAVFFLNLLPAFAPPTWSVLAVIRVTTDAPLLPLTIGGAAASTLGRVVLAFGSARLARVLPEKDRQNADALGAFLHRHSRWTVAIVFLGCLGPLPSNALFIAAGLGRVRLARVAIAFFLSRSIADTFWVWSAGKISDSTGSLFRDQVTSPQAIAVQVAGLALVVCAFRLPWAHWLGLPDATDAETDTDARGRDARQTKPAILPSRAAQ